MSGFEPIPERTEEVARIVLDSAYRVHSRLGPGLLESVYEECLCYEIGKRGLAYQRQLGVPVVYDEIRLDIGFRLDVLVEGLVVVEIKSVVEMHPAFKSITLTYLRMTGKRLGFLINFQVPHLKEGIQRLIN
jgi:GxxExxY protein